MLDFQGPSLSVWISEHQVQWNFTPSVSLWTHKQTYTDLNTLSNVLNLTWPRRRFPISWHPVQNIRSKSVYGHLIQSSVCICCGDVLYRPADPLRHWHLAIMRKQWVSSLPVWPFIYCNFPLSPVEPLATDSKDNYHRTAPTQRPD